MISLTIFSCVLIDCCGLQFLNWNLLQTFGNQLQFWYQISSFKVIIRTLKFGAYKKVFLNLNYKLIAVLYIEHMLSQQFVCIKFSGKYQTQICIQKLDVILCMQNPYQQLASILNLSSIDTSSKNITTNNNQLILSPYSFIWSIV